MKYCGKPRKVNESRRPIIGIILLFNVFEQKTVFTKIIVLGCYKMVFPSFGEFHQKKFSAFNPLFQFLGAVRQVAMRSLRARAFLIPVESTWENVRAS